MKIGYVVGYAAKDGDISLEECVFATKEEAQENARGGDKAYPIFTHKVYELHEVDDAA